MLDQGISDEARWINCNCVTRGYIGRCEIRGRGKRQQGGGGNRSQTAHRHTHTHIQTIVMEHLSTLLTTYPQLRVGGGGPGLESWSGAQ